MRKFLFLVPALLVVHAIAQNADLTAWISGQGGKPALAVTEFRGAGTQQFMGSFNPTLFGDLQSSSLFEMKPKSLFPLANPQRPEDLREEDNKQGFALSDWSGAPVGASHVVFGYSAIVNDVLVLYGYVYDARQPDIKAAQLLYGRYTGTVDEAGAIKVAHAFANDIIQKFGGTGSLLGSRIYFVSNRGGAQTQEIWTMDWDGNNQKPLTNLKSISITPGISPDGSRLAFTTFARGTPRLMVLNTETGRPVGFYNQDASLNTTPGFSPDGKLIYYASTAGGGSSQIVVAGVDGQGFRRVSSRNAVEVEPKVNPKNPGILLFVGGPGHQQIYRMNTDGAGVERVTNGEGEAANPAWHPDGEHLLFSWTRGYSAGDWNVFVMDIASKQYVQLTHSEGKNENPTWAPDGRHIVFASTRSGRSQLYTMLADGTQVKQLTQQGTNKYPVWGAK